MPYPDKLFFHLKEHYTPAEAKARIDAILEPFGESCKIEFRQWDAEIIDSYRVKSKAIRHLVCEIIRRTGLTERSYENMAAEWMVHTASYEAGVSAAHAKDVSLDYDEDPRPSVKWATRVFDLLNIE